MKAALLYIVCVLLCGRLILTQHLPWCWSLGQRNDNNYTYGGYGYNITETNECLSFCVSQPACVAVDFYLTNIELFQCWLFNGSDGVEMRETTGMQRFSLSRSCIDSLPRTSTSLPTTTTTPVSTTSCFITWSLLINTNVPGGTPNPATTVDACMAACLGCYPACRGIDFEEWASPDSVVVCWLSWNGVSDYGRAPGIGHYTLVERSCYAGVLTPSNNSWCTRNATTPSQTSTTTTTTTTPFDGSSTTHSTPTSTLMPPSITTTRTTTTTTAICDITWTAYFNSSTAGATPNAARTVVECKAACIGCLPSCYAIDFKESAAGRNETSCWLMLDQSSSVNYGGIPDVVHYTIAGRRQCIGGIQPQKNNTWCTPTTIQTSPTRTTSASTTITTSLTATTSDVCWTSMIDTHSWYGVGYEITNLTECLASCVSQPACRSVDWDSNNADGLTCWLFETDAPLGEVIGVTHYILNRGCADAMLTSNTVTQLSLASAHTSSAPTNCSYGEYRCPSDGRCIRPSWFCDYYQDCVDNTDEANCGFPAVNMNISLIYSTQEGPNRSALWKLFGNPDDYATKLNNMTAHNRSIPFRILFYDKMQPNGYYDTLAVDYSSSTLFFVDNANNRVHFGPFIYGMDYLQGDNYYAENFQNKITGAAYDWLSRNFYWTDGVSITIVAAYAPDHFLQFSRLLTNTSLYDVVAIAVDPINRYLFWADAAVSNTIFRADLLANNRVNITVGCSPTKLQIDVTEQNVYFLDPVNGKFGRVSYAGSDLQVLSDGFTGFSAFAMYENYLFFGEKHSTTIRIYNKQTLQPISSYTITGTETGQFSVTDMVVFSASNQPSGDNACAVDKGGCRHVCVANSSTTAVCLCRNGYSTSTDGRICCDDSQYTMCRTNGACVRRSQRCNHYYQCEDGTDEADCGFPPANRSIAIITTTSLYGLWSTMLVTFGNPGDYVKLIRNVTDNYDSAPYDMFSQARIDTTRVFSSVAVDFRESLVYFADNEMQRLTRGPYLFNNSTVTNTSVAVSTEIIAITLDWLSKNLYWTDGRSISITKFNEQNSTTYTRKLIGDVEPGNITDIAVDPTQRYIFWCSSNNTLRTIYRSDLAGNNRAALTVNGSPSKLVIDAPSGRIYYMDTDRHFISSISYNGTAELTSAAIVNNYSTAFTIYEDFVFVGASTDFAYITVFNKTAFQTIAVFHTIWWSGANVLDMTTYSASSQPLLPSNPCAVNLGGCQHICIASTTETNVCLCADGTTTLDGGKTCLAENAGFQAVACLSMLMWLALLSATVVRLSGSTVDVLLT